MAVSPDRARPREVVVLVVMGVVMVVVEVVVVVVVAVVEIVVVVVDVTVVVVVVVGSLWQPTWKAPGHLPSSTLHSQVIMARLT